LVVVVAGLTFMRALARVRLELAQASKTSRAWALNLIIRVDWPPSGEQEAQTDSYNHITNTTHINLTHTPLTTVTNNTHTSAHNT
jgi:hypothetical protein